jgi:hypothetical protein
VCLWGMTVMKELTLPLNCNNSVTHYTLIPCTLEDNQSVQFELSVGFEENTRNPSTVSFLFSACDIPQQCVMVRMSFHFECTKIYFSLLFCLMWLMSFFHFHFVSIVCLGWVERIECWRECELSVICV